MAPGRYESGGRAFAMGTTTFYFLPPVGEQLDHSTTSELLQVAIALNAGRSPAELVDVLFERLDGLVPYDRIGVALLEPDDVLRSHYVRSSRPILWGVGASARLQGTTLEPIVKERKVRIIEDLAAHHAAHPGSKTTPLLLAEGMRASLTVPLATASGPLGVMFFSSVTPHAYGPEHVAFVSAIAEGIAASLERARLIERLRTANDDLEALDRLKSNFLANLSHELRTPLTLVQANAEALEDEAGATLAPPHRRYVSEILAGAARLGRMLDTLFDFTAIEAGRLVVEKLPLDVGALVRELVGELGPGFAEAGLELVTTVRDEPLLVEADPPRLTEVLKILLDNARKFTPPPGMVQIRAGREGRRVWVEVQDSGIGIRPEHHERVFDSFFQVDSDASRAYGGAGLGLALAKAIVLAHGGSIVLRSAPGLGAIFTVYLPQAPEGAVDATARPAAG
jgi:signal transduction histidine kinase